MTPEQEALLEVTRALESLGILHMVAGSVASSYHGRPRSTHDVDIVIDPSDSGWKSHAKGPLGTDFGKLSRCGTSRPFVLN